MEQRVTLGINKGKSKDRAPINSNGQQSTQEVLNVSCLGLHHHLVFLECLVMLLGPISYFLFFMYFCFRWRERNKMMVCRM